MTLSFSWATNANYSTGPNVGTPTRIDPASTANGFINGTIAAAQHINFLFDAVGDQLVQAVDGVGGGTYTLGSALRFQGADVEINAGLEILASGELNVQNGGLVQVLSGGLVDVLSGGQIEISSGASISVASGGLIDVVAGGAIEMNASEDLRIDDVINFFRLTLTPVGIEPGVSTDSWSPRIGAAFVGPTLGWLQADTSAAFTIAFPLNLPVGDDILEVTAFVDGSQAGVDHADLPATLPVLSLVRVSATGVATVVARRVDQSANVAAYNLQHSIVLANGALDAGTLPHTVLVDEAYYLVLTGETGANAQDGKFGLISLSGECVARSYRSELMTY